MAKFYNRSVVVVSTRCEDGGVSYDVPEDVEYRVRSLGRGRWVVEDDRYRLVLRTAALQRFFSTRRYVGDYWSSGEPQYFVEEVRIYKA